MTKNEVQLYRLEDTNCGKTRSKDNHLNLRISIKPNGVFSITQLSYQW